MRWAEKEFPIQKVWTLKLGSAKCCLLMCIVHMEKTSCLFARNSSAVSLAGQWHDDLRFPALSGAGLMIQEKQEGDTICISCPR